MTKFDFIGAVFMFIGAVLSLVYLWSWWSYTRLRKRGRTEELPAQARVGRGAGHSQQVRLIVELRDSRGEVFELRSRSTSNDWVAHDGEPVTVCYDPDAPLEGWIELDFRRRTRLMAIIAPLLLLIGGGFFLVG